MNRNEALQDKQEHIKRLLRSCQEGDTRAQFEVYKLYYKAMFNTALRIVQDPAQAEDVMQEAFLSAFTKLHTFKGEVPFGAWLKRIVINKSLTAVKKARSLQEVKLVVVEHQLEGDASGIASEDRNDYASMRVQEVMAAMGKLKDNYRVILNLSLIEGYDNEEIAGILDISNESCRTTISRAKSKLRQILTESSVIN